MTPHLQKYEAQYLAYRASLIKNTAEESSTLRAFLKFIKRKKEKIITRKLLLTFLSSLKVTPYSKYRKIQLLRAFTRYVKQIDSRHFVPENRFFKKPKSNFKPYIFSESEVMAMMKYARQKLWTGPQRLIVPILYETLVGLLWSTGMRISEAVNLNMGDIDWKQDLIVIKQTKFYKSRLLPVKKSTMMALAKYMAERNSYDYPKGSDSPFFFNWRMRGLKRGRYTGDAFHEKIHEIIVALKIKGPTGRCARPYDLRHSFATNRLSHIYESERALHQLPLIATYMGHAKISHTQTYLHPTPELLAKVGKSFFEQFKAAT